MITYQDLLAAQENDRERAEFVRRIISDHKGSKLYKWAIIGDDYDRGMNTTITTYQKTLTTLSGRVVPDQWSATHRSTSSFFRIFTTQLASYLLGNGAEWQNSATDKKLGNDFDTRLYEAGQKALAGGVSFGFWNVDHMEVFSPLDFAPLYDEENGALMAGVKFWQIDAGKPLRAILFEPDGCTHFLWSNKNVPPAPWAKIAGSSDAYMQGKRPYVLKTRSSEEDGTKIYDGENYPAFPVVPLWANRHHQSEIEPLRETIDEYDFILNGFADDLDNAQLYWIIRGAGGMDDIDLARFLDRLRLVKAAAPEDGQDVEAREVGIPYEARERLLDRLEKQLYKDAMILNPQDIAGGAATATEIKAAYEPQNVKADQFEYCVLDFLDGILTVAGIEDKATFTRSVIVNTQEEVQTVVMAAQYLSDEYVTKKVVTLLGDGDQAEEILEQMAADAEDRLGEMEDQLEKAREENNGEEENQPEE